MSGIYIPGKTGGWYMKVYDSCGECETRQIAKEIAKELKTGDVVALVGDLGSGKTAFVKGVAEFFECSEPVSSPTFALVNRYDGREILYHFDVYRLENPTLEECDWMDDYLFGDGICLIEWADNIKDALPKGTIRIAFSKCPQNGEDYRKIAVFDR